MQNERADPIRSDLARFERLSSGDGRSNLADSSGFVGANAPLLLQLSFFLSLSFSVACLSGWQLALLSPLPIKMRFDGRIINHVSVRILVTGLRFSSPSAASTELN